MLDNPCTLSRCGTDAVIFPLTVLNMANGSISSRTLTSFRRSPSENRMAEFDKVVLICTDIGNFPPRTDHEDT